MDHSVDKLRRAAKKLRKSHEAGEKEARQRLRLHLANSDTTDLRHADYLHVIARENGFISWPELKLAVEMSGMGIAQKQQRLKMALFNGQHHVVSKLLADTPKLAEGAFGLQCALYDADAVRKALEADPKLATRKIGPRRPILHLAFSKHIHAAPEREADMLTIAQLLVDAGADVDDGYAGSPGSDELLSALYGAIGHADNMTLGQWLLDHGANPNDGESLYHACELPHREGLRMLLAAGANPEGTNALLRALDFDDLEKVRMLIAAGADPNAFHGEPVGGEEPWVIPALHQAARRMRGREVADLLLEAGMDASARYQSLTPYALARAFGNAEVAEAIVQAGGEVALTETEAVFAVAAEGGEQNGIYLDTAKLPAPLRDIISELIGLPDRLDHIRRLVALGVEYDRPNAVDVTPVQLAGWEGKPDLLTYFVSLRPNMGHINGYGGTLLSTIIHGAENCPRRAERDHLACARAVLEHGVALPKWAIDMAGDEAMLGLLKDWAAAHPGQVTEG